MIQNVLFSSLGIAFLAFAFYDVYATILRATKRPGPISENINRGFWWSATRISKRLDRRGRHRFLTIVGPLLLPLLLGFLILLLVSGFALIYLPRIETHFTVSEAAHTESWLEAVYFSGVTLLTIGYGDILPHTGSMRLAAVLEGAAGIALISLGVTYLLTIYDALESKRAAALHFYHQAKQGADVPGFIARYFVRGQFDGLTDALKTATRDLQEMLESHLEHPVIHYFHPLEVYKGLPRPLFLMLETVTILCSCLDSKYIEAGDHPQVSIAEENARFVLNELISSLDLEKLSVRQFESRADEQLRRRKTFRRANRVLRQAGIDLRENGAEAFTEYAARREEWEAKLFRLGDFLGYDWDEVTGDRDFSDATDDEVEERHEQIETLSNDADNSATEK